jgi:hypothetical protein
VILHITNGDCAADLLRVAFPEDKILPWRDVLHDGPVPRGPDLHAFSEVRAQFLGKPGCFAERDALLERYGSFRETVLWFEHDLYDQLQLIQLLDWFADKSARVTLVQTDDYLGNMSVDRLRALFPSRSGVTSPQYKLGHRAWTAFREPDPNALIPFLDSDPALPWLAPALRRFCEEYPSLADDLTRTERVIRELQGRGVTDRMRLFEEFQKTEEPKFMGDTSFFRVLDGARRMDWLWDATSRRFVRRPS